MLNICMADIDEQVSIYINNYGHEPKFILFDKETFEHFSKTLLPKEKIKIKIGDKEIINFQSTKIDRIYSSFLQKRESLQVFAVDTDENLFTVVG